MPSLDVFASDAFNMQSLTNAVNRVPFRAQFLGSLNLFEPRPITTLTALVEERQGKLSVLSTSARGTINDVRSQPKRVVRPFIVPHVPYYQTIRADDVQSIRAFGSESELETVAKLVNESLMAMRQDHEMTHEWHRLGAIQGVVYDANGTSVIHNYLTEFGVTQATDTFNFGSSGTEKVAALCNACHRTISENVGGANYTGMVGICGNQFFDWLVGHSDVTTAYTRWQDSYMLRVSQLGPDYPAASMNGILFGDILWVNYRGLRGNNYMISTNDAYVFPLGVPGMFQAVMAPADMIQTVNTPGMMIYSAQELLPFGKGVELHTQSNVLFINTYPGAVIKITGSSS